ncbi:homeobox protein MSH-A-like [Gigantopelta aegis]|uniref:homeobox protein MSH-A-like n=1 Tax=Gigantopelta aegis TaxID=1735272 RepID=UPI001B888040|nr:homeobox protein MSH-A-like [Gigantopelta aegis]
MEGQNKSAVTKYFPNESMDLLQFATNETDSNFENGSSADSDETNEPTDQPAITELKFSIKNILGLDKESVSKIADQGCSSKTLNNDDKTKDDLIDEDSSKFSWLQCTRYKPPKLPRRKNKDGVKRRKLGRNPRVPFTQNQVSVLEEKFRRTHYLSSMDVAELSSVLSLSDNRVKIWFQNRRARERRDRESAQISPLRQKSFQPLLVPSVTWPLYPATGSLAQLHSVVQHSRMGFLPSAFSMYLPHHDTNSRPACTETSVGCVDSNM